MRRLPINRVTFPLTTYFDYMRPQASVSLSARKPVDSRGLLDSWIESSFMTLISSLYGSEIRWLMFAALS